MKKPNWFQGLYSFSFFLFWFVWGGGGRGEFCIFSYIYKYKIKIVSVTIVKQNKIFGPTIKCVPPHKKEKSVKFLSFSSTKKKKRKQMFELWNIFPVILVWNQFDEKHDLRRSPSNVGSWEWENRKCAGWTVNQQAQFNKLTKYRAHWKQGRAALIIHKCINPFRSIPKDSQSQKKKKKRALWRMKVKLQKDL